MTKHPNFTDWMFFSMTYSHEPLLGCPDHSLENRLQAQDIFGNLTQLSLLNMQENRFKSFPRVLMRLPSLENLILANNELLRSLHPGILSIKMLDNINCWDCTSLISPPYAVCNQGIEAIRAFYHDMSESGSYEQPMISAAVIGNKKAGKTSLIRSLKDKKRVLTYRHNTSLQDETTKVFQVTEIDIDEKKLNVFDFGGDTVYHLTYQMTIKDNYIAIVVINLEQFDQLCSLSDPKTATRQLCMDYLSHLYLPCPRLGPPLLVLTHKDKLSSENSKLRQQHLMKSVEELRREMYIGEKEFSRSSGKFCDIKHFQLNDNHAIFSEDDIFIFGADSNETGNLVSMLRSLAERCKDNIVNIPQLWELVRIFFDSRKDVAFISIEDIESRFPEVESLIYILRYMHIRGQILWFEESESLCGIVFHRISAITDAISLLFHHRHETQWQERKFHFKGEWISSVKYGQLVEKFLVTGILDEALLSDLYRNHSLCEHIIPLLSHFLLLCGPLSYSPRAAYIIPFLSPLEIDIQSTVTELIPLRATIKFLGLAPPSYVYHLLTVAYLNLHTDPTYTIKAAMNGATIQHGETDSNVVHDSKAHHIIIQINTTAGKLDVSWRQLFETIEHMLNHLKSVWVASQFECQFHCAHCLLQNKEQQHTVIAPDWYTPPSHEKEDKPLDERLHNFTGIELVVCSNGGRPSIRSKVPKPLIFPCFKLTNTEKTAIEEFVKGLDNSTTGHFLTSKEDIDGIVEVIRSNTSLIDLPLQKTILIHNQEETYKMSETRGRALLISNKYESADHSKWREGSQHDHANMKLMLERFGFVVTGEHRNYPAKDIVETIYKESQLTHPDTGESVHKDLGVFVLLITTHGSEGMIYGSDGKGIRLSDMYKLVSPKNFPAMKGKPKLIFIQACSGGDRDMMTDQEVPDDRTTFSASYEVQEEQGTNSMDEQADAMKDDEDLTPADLFIMQASFDSYVSFRTGSLGSGFIRAIVATFYKHGHIHHLQTLAEMIRRAVSTYSVLRTEENMASKRKGKANYVGQMPVERCTFTSGRRLYFNPGLNMRTSTEHPLSITQPCFTPTIEVKWRRDMIRTEGVQGSSPTRGHQIVRWELAPLGSQASAQKQQSRQETELSTKQSGPVTQPSAQKQQSRPTVDGSKKSTACVLL